MKNSMSRKISAKGNVTIPLVIRNELNLARKQVRITVNEDGDIVLTPFERSCVFCGNLKPRKKPLDGKYVCSGCYGLLAQQGMEE